MVSSNKSKPSDRAKNWSAFNHSVHMGLIVGTGTIVTFAALAVASPKLYKLENKYSGGFGGAAVAACTGAMVIDRAVKLRALKRKDTDTLEN